MQVGSSRYTRISNRPDYLPLRDVVTLANPYRVQVSVAGLDAIFVLDYDGKTERRIIAN